jgi:TolA-binding protein
MNRHTWLGILAVAGISGAACNRGSEVDTEIKELKQAEQASPQVAQDLRQQLDQKKAELVRLEEKVALAERGVTDKVVQERNDVKRAVERQEQHVKNEVKEAQGASQVYDVEAERARKELEATKPPERVEGHVSTGHNVVPSHTEVVTEKGQEQAPVETKRMVERPAEDGVGQHPAEAATNRPANIPAQNP